VKDERQPTAVLLLPRTLESFILRDQAEDLLRSPQVLAVEAPQVPYGVLGRLPVPLGSALAAAQARGMKLPGEPRVVAIFHPFQYPLARALLRRHPQAKLWYGRWDRYEEAYDASVELERLEREAGRDAVLVPLAADSFPAPNPEPVAPDGTTVAVSLGHLGWRNDWRLLRTVAEEMGDQLTLLLIGERRGDQSGSDPDYVELRGAPNVKWLGHRDDEEAARLILSADVGLLPFERSPFNDAALPYRILKYARLGRRTIATDLPGAATWDHAIVRASDTQAWVKALREHAGARERPDMELREWALSQTAERQNAPLWERLRELGIAPTR
jgi:glycosyltransferase involved in cell wall biosynthesis